MTPLLEQPKLMTLWLAMTSQVKGNHSVTLGYANNAGAFVSSHECSVKYSDALLTTPGTLIDGFVVFF
jgi:hypothetical protein